MLRTADVVSLYEHPLPSLKPDVDRIETEATGGVTGSFTIKNKGGGVLSGVILSNSKALAFSPAEFSGRASTINYTIDVSQYGPGDELRTSAVIMSNGGERTLPVSVRIVPARIETAEGARLTGLTDFAEYAKEHPVSARALFVSEDFNNWLAALGYPHMDSFADVVKDADPERALDNFLIISGLKTKSYAVPETDRITAAVNPFERTPFTGELRVTKNGWGYLDCAVSVKNGAKWLKTGKSRLTSHDFDVTGVAVLTYYVSPAFLTDSLCRETLTIGDYEVTVYAGALPPVSCAMPRDSFRPGDGGSISITNNTGRDLTMEIIPDDGFMKFEGRRYFVGKYAEIPFEIRLNALQTAQLRLTKQPVVRTGVTVGVAEEHIDYKKRFELTVGELNADRKGV